MRLKSVLKYSAIVIVSVVALFLLLNLTDRDLNPEVENLITDHAQTEGVPIQGNAYFPLLGFYSEQDDLTQAGVRIHEDITTGSLDPYSIKQERKVTENKLNDECYEDITKITNCINYAQENKNLIRESLSKNEKLYDRYRNIINTYNNYIEPDPQVPAFGSSDLFEVHNLYMLYTINRLNNLTVEGALQEITPDIVFWRSVLANTENLITKMISVRFLKRDYKLASELLYQCPNCSWKVSSQIFLPLNSDELALDKTITNEFLWVSNNILHEDEESAELKDFLDFFYHYNRVMNRMHEAYSTLAKASAYQHLDNPLYMDEVISEFDSSKSTWWLSLYNDPTSKILTAIAIPQFGGYKQVILKLDFRIRSLNSMHKYLVDDHTEQNKKAYMTDVMTALSDSFSIVDKYNEHNANKVQVATELRSLAMLTGDTRITEEAQYWGN